MASCLSVSENAELGRYTRDRVVWGWSRKSVCARRLFNFRGEVAVFQAVASDVLVPSSEVVFVGEEGKTEYAVHRTPCALTRRRL